MLALMAKLVYALDLGSSEETRAGSSPVQGTKIYTLILSITKRNPLINSDLGKKKKKRILNEVAWIFQAILFNNDK